MTSDGTDAHFANSEVLTSGEFFARHCQLALSLGNMDKIKVGTLAVAGITKSQKCSWQIEPQTTKTTTFQFLVTIWCVVA